MLEMAKQYDVRYIDLIEGKTKKVVIESAEQHGLYERQRQGEISIISITRKA